jgi:hypothetical protein
MSGLTIVSVTTRVTKAKDTSRNQCIKRINSLFILNQNSDLIGESASHASNVAGIAVAAPRSSDRCSLQSLFLVNEQETKSTTNTDSQTE